MHLSCQGIVCELPPIDSGYRGEVHAIVSNIGTNHYSIAKGDRIGQIVVTPVVIAEFIDYDIKKFKNELLSYSNVISRISNKYELFRVGKRTLVKISFRGKALCIELFPLLLCRLIFLKKIKASFWIASFIIIYI